MSSCSWDPGIDPDRYPTIHRLADGLAEDRFEAEFETGLHSMLDQIGAYLTKTR